MYKPHLFPAGGLAVLNPCGTFEDEPTYIDTGLLYMEKRMRAYADKIKAEIKQIEHEQATVHFAFLPFNHFIDMIMGVKTNA